MDAIEKGSLWMQFIAAGSGTLVYFIGGTIIGWTSPTVARLLKGLDEPHLTKEEASWVVSILYIMQIVTSLPAGYLADRIGRKWVILSSALPFLLSWILVIIASSAEVLYAARIVAGLGLGLSSTVAPMYLGEIAEDRVRGALTTLFMFMTNLGAMFEQSLGPYISTKLLSILSAIFPIILVATFIWMPESPYYYIIRNRKEDAQNSLMRLRCVRNSESVKEELERIENFVGESMKNKAGVKHLVSHRGNRRALSIIVGLFTLQGFCGFIAIVSYSTVIFQESGIKLEPDIASLIMVGVQTVLSLVSASVVDIIGRRPLLITSTAFCTFALGVEGVFFYLKNILHCNMVGYDWVPVCSMVLFLSTFTFGVGAVPMVITAEIFPTNVKGIAMAITTIITSVGATAVSRLYEVIENAWGIHAVFWTFGVCTLANTIFSAIMVPETKGKTLMEIHHHLTNNKKSGTSQRTEKDSADLGNA